MANNEVKRVTCFLTSKQTSLLTILRYSNGEDELIPNNIVNYLRDFDPVDDRCTQSYGNNGKKHIVLFPNGNRRITERNKEHDKMVFIYAEQDNTEPDDPRVYIRKQIQMVALALLITIAISVITFIVKN